MKWGFTQAVTGIEAWKTTFINSTAHVSYSVDESSKFWSWRTFKTSSHTPPRMEITDSGKPLADGYVFITPSSVNRHDGTMEQSGTGFIMGIDGELVFAAEETGMESCEANVDGMTDFRPQAYNGKRYLTYWNGCNHPNVHWGYRWGHVTFIDDTYSNFTINPDLGIVTLDDANRGQIDVHEHQMTHRNTILLSSYNNTPIDPERVGAPKGGWVADAMFFEVDVATQQTIFEWRALDHMHLNASRMPHGAASKEAPWDWFHINSVQAVGDNYLVNSRHHWATYMISGEDGHVIWKLDGVNGGSFGSMPEGVSFRWQHHARAWNVKEDSMEVSVFNNMVNGAHQWDTQTRGLVFRLTLPPNSQSPPELVKFVSTVDEPLWSDTQGSYIADLGNGNSFIGYGLLPVCREYGPASDGSDLRWQARFGYDGAVQSYRVFKGEWHGTPAHWDPVVVVERRGSHTAKAYVSWNGATDIDGWVVFTGATPDLLTSLGVAEKKGFETQFDVHKGNCVQVGALRKEELIRKSNIACVTG